MKKINFLFLLVFLITQTACGQQKKYVSYTIKSGETMKSIAKDNDIKVRDLLRLNPDVSRKPEPNTVIIIPNKNKVSNVITNNSDKKTHTVKKKETLFSISQKYGISVEELKKANNLTGNHISYGRELVIPLKKAEETIDVPVETSKNTEVEEVETVVETKDVFHTVAKGDTVFNLTRRFDISDEKLFEMNPTVKTEGLKLGMIIKVGEESVEELSDQYFTDSITDKPLKIVLMLPYKLNSISDLDTKFKNKKSLLNIVTDFHSGVLVAIDSLQNQGLRVDLQVYDTENSSTKINRILDENNFEEVDAIIGPLFLKNAKLVAEKEADVPVIAPMFSKYQTTISERGLVKVAPDKKLLEQKLINYMLDNYNGENIIIAGDDLASTKTTISRIASKLKAHDSIKNIAILKPEKGYIKKERFEKIIDTVQRKNWVLLIGKDNVTTNDVVNNLGVITKEKADIQLFSFEYGFNFVNVSNNQLARLHFTYPKEAFVDTFNDATKSFKKKYRKKYYAWPSKYAIKGFDVTYDALLRLVGFDSFNEGATAGISRRVGTKFDYHTETSKSTENTGVFLIQYQENLKLKALD